MSITRELNTLRWRPVDLVDLIVRWRNQDRARIAKLETRYAELEKQIAEMRTNSADGIAAAMQRAKEAEE